MRGENTGTKIAFRSREKAMANEYAKMLRLIDKMIERHDRDGWESKQVEEATRCVRPALWACTHNKPPHPFLVQTLAVKVEVLAKPRRALTKSLHCSGFASKSSKSPGLAPPAGDAHGSRGRFFEPFPPPARLMTREPFCRGIGWQ
jgi:hypothetical protein